jgi:hypothetical protein
MIAEDITMFNSCTTENRVARGETLLTQAIIRINRIREEEANLVHLQAFAKRQGQKIYLFPARHDAPRGTSVDPQMLLRLIYQVSEQGYIKGPASLPSPRACQLCSPENYMYTGLVNVIIGTTKEVILDTDVRGTQTSVYLARQVPNK